MYNRHQLGRRDYWDYSPYMLSIIYGEAVAISSGHSVKMHTSASAAFMAWKYALGWLLSASTVCLSQFSFADNYVYIYIYIYIYTLTHNTMAIYIQSAIFSIRKLLWYNMSYICILYTRLEIHLGKEANCRQFAMVFFHSYVFFPDSHRADQARPL